MRPLTCFSGGHGNRSSLRLFACWDLGRDLGRPCRSIICLGFLKKKKKKKVFACQDCKKKKKQFFCKWLITQIFPTEPTKTCVNSGSNPQLRKTPRSPQRSRHLEQTKRYRTHISALIPPATHIVPPATRWSREKELKAFEARAGSSALDRFQRRDVCHARRTASVCLQLCSFPSRLRHLCLSQYSWQFSKGLLCFMSDSVNAKTPAGVVVVSPFFLSLSFSSHLLSFSISTLKVVRSLEFLLTFTLKEVLLVFFFFVFFSPLFFTRDGGIPV